MNKVIKIAAAAGVLISVGKWAKSAYDNLWHNLKIEVPVNSIKVKLDGIQYLMVSASLKIANHYDKVFELSKIHSTIFMFGENGELIEIGATEPNFKTVIIAGNRNSSINDITVKISTFSLLGQASKILAQPPGKRLLVRTSCYINGFPFQTDTAY